MTSFLIIDDHPLFRDTLGNAIRLAHTDARILEAMSTFGSRGWAQIMSAKGQTRKSALVTAMSAFPPIAIKLRTSRWVSRSTPINGRHQTGPVGPVGAIRVLSAREKKTARLFTGHELSMILLSAMQRA